MQSLSTVFVLTSRTQYHRCGSSAQQPPCSAAHTASQACSSRVSARMHSRLECALIPCPSAHTFKGKSKLGESHVHFFNNYQDHKDGTVENKDMCTLKYPCHMDVEASQQSSTCSATTRSGAKRPHSVLMTRVVPTWLFSSKSLSFSLWMRHMVSSCVDRYAFHVYASTRPRSPHWISTLEAHAGRPIV